MKQKKLLPYMLLTFTSLLGLGIYILLVKSVTITTYPAMPVEVRLDGKQVSTSTPVTLHLWRWQKYHLELIPPLNTSDLVKLFGGIGFDPVIYDFTAYQAPNTLAVFFQYRRVTVTPNIKWRFGRNESTASVVVRSFPDGKKEITLAPLTESLDGQQWRNDYAVDLAITAPDGNAALLEATLADNTKDCGKMGHNLDTFLWLIPLNHPEDRYPILKGINPDGSSCLDGAYYFSSDGKWIAAQPTFTDNTTGDHEDTLWVVSNARGGTPQLLSHDPSIRASVQWSPDGKQMVMCQSNLECFFYKLDEKGSWQKTGLVLHGIGASWVDNDRLWYVDTSQPGQHSFALYQLSSQQELYRAPIDKAVADGYYQSKAQQGNLTAICIDYNTIPNAISSAPKLVIANSGKSPNAIVINLKQPCYNPYFLGDGEHFAIYTDNMDSPLQVKGGMFFYHTEIRNIPPELLR